MAIIGALFGVLSFFQTWLTDHEINAMKASSGHSLPGNVIPNLNLFGLCDTGWVTSQNLGFAIAAFLFFAGTILAFYTSLGGIVQVIGFVTFYRVFDSAHAAALANLPEGFGPKVALISIIIVMASLLFPAFIWSKIKLEGLWRRFLTVAPEKNVKQAIPLLYAAGGSAIILWGQVVGTSSAYEDGTLSASLFTVAGLVFLVVAMFVLIVAWETD